MPKDHKLTLKINHILEKGVAHDMNHMVKINDFRPEKMCLQKFPSI